MRLEYRSATQGTPLKEFEPPRWAFRLRFRFWCILLNPREKSTLPDFAPAENSGEFREVTTSFMHPFRQLQEMHHFQHLLPTTTRTARVSVPLPSRSGSNMQKDLSLLVSYYSYCVHNNIMLWEYHPQNCVPFLLLLLLDKISNLSMESIIYPFGCYPLVETFTSFHQGWWCLYS